MSSFEQKQSSTAESRPIELYTFEIGSSVFRYTTSEDTITVAGSDWSPVPGMERERIVDATTRDARSLDISLPSVNALVSALSGIPPDQPTLVTVSRLQRDITPFVPRFMFQGSVASLGFSENNRKATLKVQTLESSLILQAPRIRYTALCNNFWGDGNCGVDINRFRFVGTVSVVDSLIVTVPGLSTATDTFGNIIDFVGGYVRLESTLTDFRQVLDQNGNDLTLILPFRNNVTGQNLAAFAGCNRVVTEDCAQVFNNVGNAIAFPFIPPKNPHVTGL